MLKWDNQFKNCTPKATATGPLKTVTHYLNQPIPPEVNAEHLSIQIKNGGLVKRDRAKPVLLYCNGDIISDCSEEVLTANFDFTD